MSVSADSHSLLTKLTSRGIGPAAADELAAGYPQTDVCTMIELYDWYNQRGQSRGPGFLVGAIKNPQSIVFPKGFESSASVAAKKAAEKNRISSEREFRTRREREHAERQNARHAAFLAFWENLSPADQEAFERDALNAAEPTKRSGYLRSMGKEPNPVFEQYRQIILQDHFEREGEVSQALP